MNVFKRKEERTYHFKDFRVSYYREFSDMFFYIFYTVEIKAEYNHYTL